MGAGQNKTTLTAANGLEWFVHVQMRTWCVCVCVCLYHISAKTEGRVGGREKERERQPVANGFPTGPSVTPSHGKTWGATGEQLLGNLRRHLQQDLKSRTFSHLREIK